MSFLSKIVRENSEIIHVRAKSKFDAIREMVLQLAKAGRIDENDVQDVITALIEREEFCTTGIGRGHARPHAKCPCITKFTIAIGLSKEGIDWDSMDKKPVTLVFLVLSPEFAVGAHLNVMARIQYLTRDWELEKIKNADKNSLLEIIEKAERGI